MKINDTSHIQPKQPGLKSRSDTAAPKRISMLFSRKRSARRVRQVPHRKQRRLTSLSRVYRSSRLPCPSQTRPCHWLRPGSTGSWIFWITTARSWGDPRASLRAIQPILDDIAAAKDRLAPEIDGLEDGSALKEVLNNSLVTAATEIMRFNRGDYV